MVRAEERIRAVLPEMLSKQALLQIPLQTPLLSVDAHSAHLQRHAHGATPWSVLQPARTIIETC